MKIFEILRPSGKNLAINLLKQHGYRELGAGMHGTVLAKENEPFVVKVFNAKDTAYLQFLKLIIGSTNPHFPRVKGKPMKITDTYWGVRLERLNPVSQTNLRLGEYAESYIYSYQRLKELEDNRYTNRMYKQRVKITQHDRDLLQQLGTRAGGHSAVIHSDGALVSPVPDQWKKPVVDPNEQYASGHLYALRQKLTWLEHHYPELAEALRQVCDKVLKGKSSDLHSENIMERGTILVITDPSASGAFGDLTFNTPNREPELFPSNKSASSDLAARQQRDQYTRVTGVTPDQLPDPPNSRVNQQKEFPI